MCMYLSLPLSLYIYIYIYINIYTATVAIVRQSGGENECGTPGWLGRRWYAQLRIRKLRISESKYLGNSLWT